MKKQNLWFVGIAAALMGCAHGLPPTDLMTSTEVSVRQIEQPDSMKTAPLEVKQARELLDSAKVEMNKKNYTLARRFAEKSLVNAQLAQAKTDAELTKINSDDAVMGIETLKQETKRKSFK